MTMTQKILAAHAGLDSVTAGQLIEAKLDVVMANDITGPMALPIFRQMADKVFDKDKVVLVPDHFTPNKDIKSAAFPVRTYIHPASVRCEPWHLPCRCPENAVIFPRWSHWSPSFLHYNFSPIASLT